MIWLGSRLLLGELVDLRVLLPPEFSQSTERSSGSFQTISMEKKAKYAELASCLLQQFGLFCPEF